jgi:hypothetical protein
MTHAILPSKSVIDACAKSLRDPSINLNGDSVLRLKHIRALASAAQQVSVDSEDFELLRPHWHPPISG